MPIRWDWLGMDDDSDPTGSKPRCIVPTKEHTTSSIDQGTFTSHTKIPTSPAWKSEPISGGFAVLKNPSCPLFQQKKRFWFDTNLVLSMKSRCFLMISSFALKLSLSKKTKKSCQSAKSDSKVAPDTGPHRAETVEGKKKTQLMKIPLKTKKKCTEQMLVKRRLSSYWHINYPILGNICSFSHQG